MYSLRSEVIHIPTDKPVMSIVRHYYNLPQYSKAVIITDNPRGIDGPIRKRWNVLVRRVREAKARALRSPDFAPLADQLQKMESVSFSTIPEAYLEQTITLGTAQQFMRYPPRCQILYIIGTISIEELGKVTARMSDGATVITFEVSENIR